MGIFNHISLWVLDRCDKQVLKYLWVLWHEVMCHLFCPVGFLSVSVYNGALVLVRSRANVFNPFLWKLSMWHSQSRGMLLWILTSLGWIKNTRPAPWVTQIKDLNPLSTEILSWLNALRWYTTFSFAALHLGVLHRATRVCCRQSVRW